MTRPLWIPPGKIIPPAPPAGWLERRLAAEAPIATLVAGPGYGKTLGLLALGRAAVAAGGVMVWYAVDEDDADPATFFPCLVEAVRAHVPPFGEGVLGAVAGGKLEPRALWQRFFQEVAAYNLPGLFLALDDMHRLGDAGAELVRGLAAGFERLPPGVRLGLAARKRLPVGLGRYAAKGVVAALGPEQLRFGPEEETAYLAARAGGGAIPDRWARQTARLEGWPLGLALAAALPGVDLGERELAAEELSAYLAEEVVAALPADQAAFLRRAALLEAPSAEACEAVFGVADAGARLEAAEADQLATRLADGRTWRMAAYLRDHLLAELARTSSAAERASWHRQAAVFFRERGEGEAALPHLIASGAWDEAAAACQAVFPAMGVRGRHALMARWIEAFPPDAFESEPMMAYWRGMSLARGGRNDEAVAVLERARQGCAARDDRAGELKAIVKMASIALFGQDQPRFGTLIMRSLGLIEVGRDEDRADLHLIRALAAEQRGDMALMRECNEAVLAIPIGGNIEVATCAAIAHLNLHTAALHRGDLAAAERHALHARAIGEDWDFPSYRLFAGFLLANLRLVEGHVDAAGAFLRALPPGWPDMLDWHDLGCAWTIVGHHHQAKGDAPEAERAFERARTTFERAGFAEGVKVPLERQLWLAVQRRQPARAAALAAGVVVEEARSVYDLAIQVPLARARMLEGDAAGAVATLGPAAAELEGLEAWPHVARARLAEAAARARLGETEAARAALAMAEAVIAGRGLEFLRKQDAPLWEELATLVVPAAPAAPAVEPPTASPPPALAGTPAPKGREEGTPVPEADLLTLRVFGDFEVLKAGVRLDQWPRRKAKLALAALALHPRGRASVDLAELLADGEPGAAALTTVQVNVSALRRVLEPSLAKGGASRYVLSKDERYSLDWDLVADCDVTAFERHVAEARRVRDAEPEVAARAFEAALALYRGNLLDDTFFAKYFEAERERARQQAVDALLWLAEHRVSRADDTAAADALMRAAEIAPTEESIYRRLMAHHAARRQPERVRHAYWDYRKSLKTRLGLAPEPEFERAYQEAMGKAGGG